jgi:alkylated DNA nucleotide flippase Atl1
MKAKHGSITSQWRVARRGGETKAAANMAKWRENKTVENGEIMKTENENNKTAA